MRKLASPFSHPTQLSTQVELAATCSYLRVRLTRALSLKLFVPFDQGRRMSGEVLFFLVNSMHMLNEKRFVLMISQQLQLKAETVYICHR